MNKLNEEILAKFLMGECTEDELREVNAWLERKSPRHETADSAARRADLSP